MHLITADCPRLGLEPGRRRWPQVTEVAGTLPGRTGRAWLAAKTTAKPATNLGVGLLAVALAALGCLATACGEPQLLGKSGLPFYSSAEFTASWPTAAQGQAQPPHQISAFSLTNHLDQQVTGQSLRGRIYVANFFFAHCQSVCPKMAVSMRAIQAAYRNDPQLLLLSHSVEPAMDTPESLREYAAKNQVIAGKWHLLTGDQSVIYTLARKSYFAEKSLGLQRKVDEFLHTENMLLIDGHGRIRGIYNATLPTEAERVIEDIAALKTEL